jgi:hypothetical protein
MNAIARPETWELLPRAPRGVQGAPGGTAWPSRVAAAGDSIPAPIAMITLQGFYELGDCDPFQHKRVATPASPKPWHFQSMDGAWWELCQADANVLWLGARGNAYAASPVDDQPAIQAAVDYLNGRGGGRVLYPPRAYLIASGSILTPGNAIEHVGLSVGGGGGPGAAIVAINGSADIFRMGSNDNQIQGGGVLNLCITGSLGAVRKSGGYAIANRRGFKLRFENLLLFKVYNGLEFYATNNNACSDVQIQDCNGDHGIRFWGDQRRVDVEDDNSALIGHRADVLELFKVAINCLGQADGIIWDGSAYTLICNSVHLIQPIVGLIVRNTTGDKANFPQFLNAFALEIDGATFSSVIILAGRNMYFYLPQWYGGSDRGLLIEADNDPGTGSYTGDIEFWGGRIGGCGLDCVYVDGRSVVFHGVNATGGSRASHGTYNGFHLGPNSQRVHIIGGVGGALFGDTTHHGYAVRIEPGATGYKIVAVDTQYCVNGRIYDAGGDSSGVIVGCGDVNKLGSNGHYVDARVLGDGTGLMQIEGGTGVELKVGGIVGLKVWPNSRLQLFGTSTPADVVVGGFHYDGPSGSFKAGPPSGWKTLAYNEDLVALAARVTALEA